MAKIKHNPILLIIILIILLACDYRCKKNHIFQFSYPNDMNQSEFVFDVDYSEVPLDSTVAIAVSYDFEVTNCSETNNLVIQVFTKFGSEYKYFLTAELEIVPGEGQKSHQFLGNYKEDRKISVLIKGLGSDCFNGEINIQTHFLVGGLGKAKCPYGYEVD